MIVSLVYDMGVVVAEGPIKFFILDAARLLWSLAIHAAPALYRSGGSYDLTMDTVVRML